MRILLINDYGAPVYGAELQILALRDGLRRRGHEALLFSSNAEQAAGVPLQADAACFGTTRRLQAASQAVNLSAYVELRRCLRRFKPDVVHVCMFLWQLSPLILPLLRGFPCLHHAVVYKTICPAGLKLLPDGSPCRVDYGRACLSNGCVALPTWIATMAQLALFERWKSAFQLVTVPSAAMRDLLQASGAEVARVVPNGIVAPPMRPPLSDPPLVAYAGRLAPEKGVDVLLRAFAASRQAIPAARLMVAGDGPLQQKLRELVESLGIAASVEWLGYVSREQLEERFAAAWVQAVPSLWQEPFGGVTAEAMIRGTAVVASDVGGASDIVTHGQSGLLVPPGDVVALTQALTRTLHDRGEAERIGAAARSATLETLGEERMIDTFLALYGEMIISS